MADEREPARAGLADLPGGGFFIRRVGSPWSSHPGRRVGSAPQARSSSSNKENIQPPWTRTTSRGETLLPEWWPRRALTDITRITQIMRETRERQRQMELEALLAEEELLAAESPRTPIATLSIISPGDGHPSSHATFSMSPGDGPTSLPNNTPSTKSSEKPVLRDKIKEKNISLLIEEIEHSLPATDPRPARKERRERRRNTLMSLR